MRGCLKGERSTIETSSFEHTLSSARKQAWNSGNPPSATTEVSRESVYEHGHEAQVGRLAEGWFETVDPTRHHPLGVASVD